MDSSRTVTVLCTHDSTSERDDEGLLPAYRRYRSNRIREVYDRAVMNGIRCFILTGEYGLLDAEADIPAGNRRLESHGVAEMVNIVAEQLRQQSVTHLSYITQSSERDPNLVAYMKTIAKACNNAGVELNMVYLD